MKTKLFALLILAAFTAGAQTYSISPAKTVTFTAPFDYITINDIYQVNTGSSKIVLLWERVSVDLPTGWDYSMCDLGTCYAGVPAGPTTMDTVEVGNSGFLGLNIDPMNIAGSGTVKVFVYQKDFKSSGDTLTWHVNGVPTGFEEIGLNSGVRIFPNPAQDVLQINIGNHEMSKGHITDALGRTVAEFSLTGGINTVNISALDKGIYTVQIQNKEKTLFKRIIKE